MAKKNDESLWSIQEVAEYLNVPVETLRVWRKKNSGPKAGRMGKHLRYDPEHVREWFRDRGGVVA